MDPDKDRGSRYANITDISGKLKQIAKEHGVPIMALAQLSRETERRDDKKPKIADLKDTGAIEQDADMILLLLREEYYLEESKPEEAHPDFMKWRSEEHTSELQSLMRISYAVFCLKKKK